MEPTPLRISTMTVTGHLGSIPDLHQLFEAGACIPYWWVGEGILKIELAGQRKGFCSEDILHRITKERKRFFNQSSLVFRLALKDANSSIVTYKETNIKLFKNGGFQMTGISSEAMARAALTRLIEMNEGRGIWTETPYIKVFEVQMMNSDYSIGRAIRRDRLHRTLVETYGLWSTFEPTIYQGVNTKFFWNKARPEGAPPGICVCPTPCDGSGDGYKVGACKKITISPFRTGSVIITGAKNTAQLEDAYAFMNGIFTRHADQVLRPLETPALEALTPRRAAAPPTGAEAILRQKMRASPRNIMMVPVR